MPQYVYIYRHIHIQIIYLYRYTIYIQPDLLATGCPPNSIWVSQSICLFLLWLTFLRSWRIIWIHVFHLFPFLAQTEVGIPTRCGSCGLSTSFVTFVIYFQWVLGSARFWHHLNVHSTFRFLLKKGWQTWLRWTLFRLMMMARWCHRMRKLLQQRFLRQMEVLMKMMVLWPFIALFFLLSLLYVLWILKVCFCNLLHIRFSTFSGDVVLRASSDFDSFAKLCLPVCHVDQLPPALRMDRPFRIRYGKFAVLVRRGFTARLVHKHFQELDLWPLGMLLTAEGPQKRQRVNWMHH